MRKILILIIVNILVLSANSQQKLTIKGSIPESSVKYIAIKGYKDPITLETQVLASQVIDSTLQFELNFPIKGTQYAILQHGFQETEIYLEEGKTYNLKLTSTGNYSEGSAYEMEKASYELFSLNDKELNYEMNRFNSLYNDFILEHFKAINRFNRRDLVDTLNQKIKEAKFINNKFFNESVRFRMAGLELASKRKSDETLYHELIEGKPVLWNNIEYMTFVNNLFEQYLIQGGKKRKATEIRESINDSGSLKAVRNIISDDLFMKNPELNDLIIAKSFYEMLGKKTLYKRHQVIKVLKQLKAQTKYPQIKIIVDDILSLHNRLKIGSTAPKFTVKNKDKEVSLDDYKGSFVLINFWKSSNMGSIYQMQFLDKIIKELPSFHIVCISANESFKQDLKVKYQYGYKWDFFNFNNDFGLLDKYQVKFFPSFILIDPNGNIYKNPAPFPDGELKNFISKAIINWGKKK